MLTRVTTWPAFSSHTPSTHYLFTSLQRRPFVVPLACYQSRSLGDPGDGEKGTFTLPAEEAVDSITCVTDTTKLGYSYPGFSGLNIRNANTVRDAILASIIRMYGSLVFGVLVSFQPTLNFAVISVHRIWEWTALIEFKEFDLRCSFSVLLFLGEVPENPDEWLIAPNYIGSHSAFVNRFVPLNNAIAEYSRLDSFEPEVVEPYLKELKWRVQKLDREPAELSSLEVSVIGTPLTLPPGATTPVAGKSHHYNGITSGRCGGCRNA
ncbi:hypothetical protein BDQ17DRAFT_1325298 [Cyathus striatus]|nr:hypothetical protein BDQ17DRAFT_1325298 [Cyathus striatus]